MTISGVSEPPPPFTTHGTFRRSARDLVKKFPYLWLVAAARRRESAVQRRHEEGRRCVR